VATPKTNANRPRNGGGGGSDVTPKDKEAGNFVIFQRLVAYGMEAGMAKKRRNFKHIFAKL
jgi:hypothetical protein